jgi:hypothetical protein
MELSQDERSIYDSINEEKNKEAYYQSDTNK